MSVELLSNFVIPGMESLQRDIEDLLPQKNVCHCACQEPLTATHSPTTTEDRGTNSSEVDHPLFSFLQSSIEELLDNFNSKVQDYKKQEM